MSGGAGLALLLEPRPSPALAGVVRDFQRVYPTAHVYLHEAISTVNQRVGAERVGAARRGRLYEIDAAKRIVALDSDFLGTEGDSTRNTALFTKARQVETEADEMSRLYSVDSALTLTGMMADNRLVLPASQIGGFLGALTAAVLNRTHAAPPANLSVALGAMRTGEKQRQWVEAIADDLVAHRGESLVIVGDRQPAWVHMLGHYLNDRLGAVGQTLLLPEDRDRIDGGSIRDLAAAIGAGQVETLVMVGGNPVQTAPAGLVFRALLEQVDLTVHLSGYRDETSQASTWHIPTSHYLEAWGDLRATDGTVSIQQPLIAPLYGTKSELEVLAGLNRFRAPDMYQDEVDGTPPEGDLGYQLVRSQWRAAAGRSGNFDDRWRRWLHDGVLADVLAPASQAPVFDWSGLSAAIQAGGEATAPDPAAGAYELDFRTDYSVFDGRYANNGWLQELPDPVTKLTWDNAACIAPATAESLGVSNGDLLRITVAGVSRELPVWITPGTAAGVVAVSFGYGRAIGPVSEGAGFDVYPLRADEESFFVTGVALEATGDAYELVTTQHHGSLVPREGFEERPIIRENTLAGYREDPDFVEAYEVLPEEELHALYQTPLTYEGQRWGMSIDLSACTGCSTCVLACQAENNISVVGKERVQDGREMHWLRVDRYFTGEPEDAQAVVQPIPCQQCANAPCETVCPVAATTHSPEGLNDMAYNRCIGTRYCANNCPYKVRRFNFFNFTNENDEMFPALRAQRNPDVTMRFRGVMEKCTYCVQRINQAKIANHKEGRDEVSDGEILPACAQACPARAIVFGDVNDPDSLVSKLKRQNRDFVLFRELQNDPQTSYMAKLRNPNPALEGTV